MILFIFYLSHVPIPSYLDRMGALLCPPPPSFPFHSSPTLAGNVADMSRHVGDGTTCRSNFGQMGPCRQHKILDVVAVCVGSSRHFTKFSEFVCRNILLYIYISSLGSYVLMGYVSSKVRCEYRSNVRAVG